MTKTPHAPRQGRRDTHASAERRSSRSDGKAPKMQSRSKRVDPAAACSGLRFRCLRPEEAKFAEDVTRRRVSISTAPACSACPASWGLARLIFTPLRVRTRRRECGWAEVAWSEAPAVVGFERMGWPAAERRASWYPSWPCLLHVATRVIRRWSSHHDCAGRAGHDFCRFKWKCGGTAHPVIAGVCGAEVLAVGLPPSIRASRAAFQLVSSPRRRSSVRRRFRS